MRKVVSSSLLVILPLQLAACGSDTPSFQERPQALIRVAVNSVDDPGQMSGESFDIESLDSGDDTSGSSADATADTGDNANPLENSFANPGTSRDSNGLPGRPSESNRGPIQDPGSAGDSSSDARSMPIPDTKTVAKACAPAMKNLGKAMTVVTVQESNSAITLSPNSVVALKIVGNRTKVILDLDGTLPLPGLCFFMAGHETELEFTTASSVKSLALIETGDQAKARITLNGGSSESLSVDLRGHNPSLTINGVNADLCAAAAPRNGNANYQCQP